MIDDKLQVQRAVSYIINKVHISIAQWNFIQIYLVITKINWFNIGPDFFGLKLHFFVTGEDFYISDNGYKKPVQSEITDYNFRFKFFREKLSSVVGKNCLYRCWAEQYKTSQWRKQQEEKYA